MNFHEFWPFVFLRLGKIEFPRSDANKDENIPTFVPGTTKCPSNELLSDVIKSEEKKKRQHKEQKNTCDNLVGETDRAHVRCFRSQLRFVIPRNTASRSEHQFFYLFEISQSAARFGNIFIAVLNFR